MKEISPANQTLHSRQPKQSGQKKKSRPSKRPKIDATIAPMHVDDAAKKDMESHVTSNSLEERETGTEVEGERQTRRGGKKESQTHTEKGNKGNTHDQKGDGRRTHAEEEEGERQTRTGRAYTVSIALPGSIMDNAQSPELCTYLAGQIGRALSVFQVDEIIILDENEKARGDRTHAIASDSSYLKFKKGGEGSVFLARLLQYMETPQYLRKHFFPRHPDLRFVGLLNPLDTPHHMRADEDCDYREGVTLEKPVRPGKGSWTDCGLAKPVMVDKLLQPGVRVTVKLDKASTGKTRRGVVVSPSQPREKGGLYWGYRVRLANDLKEMLALSPYEGGYDYVIGTSERGDSVEDFTLPPFKHLLVVFGGLAGLEDIIQWDDSLPIESPRELFDAYLNTCKEQGSRTIRTEEAILVSMSALRPAIQGNRAGDC